MRLLGLNANILASNPGLTLRGGSVQCPPEKAIGLREVSCLSRLPDPGSNSRPRTNTGFRLRGEAAKLIDAYRRERVAANHRRSTAVPAARCPDRAGIGRISLKVSRHAHRRQKRPSMNSGLTWQRHSSRHNIVPTIWPQPGQHNACGGSRSSSIRSEGRAVRVLSCRREARKHVGLAKQAVQQQRSPVGLRIQDAQSSRTNRIYSSAEPLAAMIRP